MSQERRVSRRCSVEFFVQEHRNGQTWLHPAVNLSETGLYLIVSDDERAIDATAALQLEFTLPSGVGIHATGRIAYVDDRDGQRGLGVDFAELSDSDRDAISQLVGVTHAAQRRLREIA